MLVPAGALAASTAHCGGGDGGSPAPPAETGGDTEVDSSDIDTGTADAKPDTPDDSGPTVTCTKSPVFHPAVRVNHNPDSLRRVANAGMVRLDDGRIMVAMLEAVDTGSRYGVWARTVDPATGKAAEDERLDLDADGLVEGSRFQILALGGGAVAVRYGDGHVKVWSKNKWSPDLASVLTLASDDGVGWLTAPSGQVLVTRTKSSAPFGEATVYRPDEGGVKGSWSPPQPLDLDGATSRPSRLDRVLLPDGRFLVMIWQGAGGPALRIRSLSGSWSTPFAKAEIGPSDASPSYALLDDGSIVLVALEGTGDTRRAVTSTWNATDGWTTARLLSKPTAESNGVIPTSGQPFLFPVSGTEVEFVAWVAGCAGAAKDCTFKAVTRRYSGGSWKDPVDLAIGDATRTGADGTMVVALEGGLPLVARVESTLMRAELRVRTDAGEFKPKVNLTGDSPYFGVNTRIEPRFYGGQQGVWALAKRDNVPEGGTASPLPVALGKIDPSADKVTWGLVTAGAFEMRGFGSPMYPYALGSGGFTIGVNSATDGSSSSPIIAYATAAGGSPEAGSAMSSDESNAFFVNYPRTSPRPGRDRSAIYVVSAKLADTSATGNRLRAYAFNGVGGTVPKILAGESRAPRSFSDGSLSFGCGGAILFAVDPTDGSHALELVFVKEEPVAGG
ncbi:MAG: hypothetical protein HYV09_38005 [Deltaproteobacteria bacterium]|nr:hypothetical protein [Deltaproteobacteria bacterium]